MKSFPFLVAFLFTVTNTQGNSQEEAPFPPPPTDVSSIATIVADNEPGERLVINGIVYEADGRTPLGGFLLYLYQTDSSGVYNTTDRSWQRPRIRGWVKTDTDGKYEIRTIKPGSYPGSRNPAHIHAIVKAAGREPEWIDEFLFEGDPFLTTEDRKHMESEGQFSSVMRVTQDEMGVLRCRRDIKISTSE